MHLAKCASLINKLTALVLKLSILPVCPLAQLEQDFFMHVVKSPHE
jgi:hypothetical protein